MRQTLTVQFTYMHEADPAYWALPVPVELRAEVTLSADGNDEPFVEPLEKARWEDALGSERGFAGVRNPAWIGADEAAVDAACEVLSKRSTVESGEMAVAS